MGTLEEVAQKKGFSNEEINAFVNEWLSVFYATDRMATINACIAPVYG
jgi:hypothetical protein